ncbi:MAG: AI-2E family transporter [Halieaceae bacterium]|nr:AI-2E family transporter [Halieaceae bacterium]
MESMMRPSRQFLGLPLLLALAVLLWLVYELRPILSPFVIGALIAYLGDPVTDWLEARGMGRSLAVSLVFLGLTLLFMGSAAIMLPLLLSQVNVLVRGIPVAYEWATTSVLPWLQNILDLPPESVPRLQIKRTLAENWQSLGKMLAALGRYVGSSSANLALSLGNAVLVPVVAFYLLRDWDKITPKLMNLLPEDWQGKGEELSQECDEVIGAFLRGQLLVMMALTFIYSAGLMIIGLNVAVAIGVFAGLFAIVPYLGTVMGIGAAAIAAWIQFGEFSALLGVAAVFTVAQMIESYILTPYLVGDRIGLHPVAVIFAVLAGGQLAGFVGVLVGLPVAAVIAVLLRHVKDYYKASDFYAGDNE